MAPGYYRLKIVVPQGYTFPSKLLWNEMPAGRLMDATGSYGNSFWIGTEGFMHFDVPLDPPLGTGIFLQKAALVRDAEIGGTVEYVLTLKNVSGLLLNQAVIRDVLPRGFSFVAGTARRDGATSGGATTALPDPTTLSNRTLVFSLGDLLPDSTQTIRYRARIGAGAVEGRAINSARASATTPVAAFNSNEASARVQVAGGVFTTRAILIGKIWIDTNRNARQDKGELPVPGVRVFLENGNYAVTDSEGRYSIYGALPITHIVKVDTATLPAGSTLEQLTTLHNRAGITAFADLKNGEMQKVDFALINPSESVVSNVRARIKQGDPLVPEVDARLRADLPATPEIVRSTDTRNRAGLASGVVSGSGTSPDGTTPNAASNPITRERDGAQTPVEAPAAIDTLPRRTADDGPLDGDFGPVPSPSLPSGGPTLEDEIKSAKDGKLEILNLSDGQSLASDNVNVRVKGTLGTSIKLFLNGQEQPSNRIGTRSSDDARGIQGLE